MGKVYDWFEERLEVQAIADDISSKYVPPHVNIFYCFGGIVFTCFLVQVAIQEGLASKALTVYFWRTNSTRMNKVLGIQCHHCHYAVHGTWTKNSTADAIESLSRLFCAFVVPSASGIDNLPQLPLQH